MNLKYDTIDKLLKILYIIKFKDCSRNLERFEYLLNFTF